MEPKMVTSAFDQISRAYGETHSRLAASEAARASQGEEIIRLRKLVVDRDREISELKRQREEDLPRLAREIDGWKAKYESATTVLNSIRDGTKKIQEDLASTQAKLAAETARADALAQKYDPEIKAELAAKAEAETKRQIAELEAKLKALKKE